MPWRLVAVAVGAVLLWGVGMQTRMFGAGYETISWRGALFFFVAMATTANIDRSRHPIPAEERIAGIWTT